jgi:hypothetical protein
MLTVALNFYIINITEILLASSRNYGNWINKDVAFEINLLPCYTARQSNAC